MNAERQAKHDQVSEITSKITSSKALVIAEYAGLTVKELQELRNELETKGVEAKVYKNRLFKIAAKENGLSELDENLTGPNLYVFGNEDEISPAKILAKFAKEHEALKIKAGTYEGKVVDATVIAEIATLPSLEEALTMLATSMISPIKYIGSGLNMLATEGHLKNDEAKEATPEVKEKPKTETAEAEEVAETKEESIEPEAKAEETVETVKEVAEDQTEVKDETQEETTPNNEEEK